MNNSTINIITAVLFITSLVCYFVGYGKLMKATLREGKTPEDCTKNNAKGSDCGYWDSKDKMCTAGVMSNNKCTQSKPIGIASRLFFILGGLLMLSAIVFPIVMYFMNKKHAKTEMLSFY